MTQVKVGQVWKDKDKRRNTVIEILKLVDNYAQALVVGTEDERSYDIERLVKRWELIETKTYSTVEEADSIGNIVESTYEMTVEADGKSGTVRKVNSKLVSRAEKPEPVFEWDGKGSIKTLTEHAHIHTHGECVKNRDNVPCDVPKAQVAVWVGKKPEPEVIIPGSTKEELEEARVELKAAASKNWQLKAVCQENEDYKVRFTKRIAEVYGMPLCPCHKKPLVFTEGH